MTPEQVAGVVGWWVRRYTRGLPLQVAERRIGEIDADLYDHIQHGRDHGDPDGRLARSILSRLLRGLPADLVWRSGQTRPHRNLGRAGRTLLGGPAMRHATAAATTVLVAAAVLVLVWFFSGVLLGQFSVPPHPLAIVSWLAYGGGVTALSRWVPRPVAMGAAGLVGAVALTNLYIAPTGQVVGAAIAHSEYTWIGIAILAANGAIRSRTPAPADKAAAAPDPTS